MKDIPQELKIELLSKLYVLQAEWLTTMPLACGKGCAACCTQSVTMTGLEGEQITNYLQQEGRLAELDIILAERSQKSIPAPLTTNEFAEYCLKGIEPKEPIHEEWDFTPCPFLHENCCTIYPARPFGCRAFVSTVNCSQTGSAEIAPLALTINTTFTQVVEHLGQGGKWGKMLDILTCYRTAKGGAKEAATEAPLRDAKPIPGLIVCEEEQKPVVAILGRFMAKSVKGEQIRSLLKLEGII
ncbi:MAG: YkgJ family cysteine cluster protein [Desulfobulbaceae bacterium]|nr:YkgJ family cysteine cluster protein [Desulfobulbaceae bacterium]